MPPLAPLVRMGWKVAPIVIEVARQVDKQVRPHLRAYQLARSVDGYVGRWTAQDGTHWVVFKRERSAPLEAFPPLSAGDLQRVGRDLDRAQLTHHSVLAEAKVLEQLQRVTGLPGRIRGRGDGPRIIDLRPGDR